MAKDTTPKTAAERWLPLEVWLDGDADDYDSPVDASDDTEWIVGHVLARNADGVPYHYKRLSHEINKETAEMIRNAVTAWLTRTP